MEIKVGRRDNDYPTNRFQIMSHPEWESAYYSLREIADKYSGRNANAKKIGDLLDVFTKSLFAAVPQGAEYATIDVDIAPLTEAIAINEAARANAKPTYPCAGQRNGCAARVSTPRTFCARCQHDED